MRIALAVLLLACWIVPNAGADTYRYETDEGTLAFTDELKRVPAKYRDGAEKLVDRSLWTYPRLTPVPRGATTQAMPSVVAEETQAVSPERSPAKVAVEVSKGLWVQLDPVPSPHHRATGRPGPRGTLGGLTLHGSPA